MADYRKIAQKYIDKGFSVIPVNAQKNPSIPTWFEYQKRLMTPEEVDKHFKDTWGIALLMGGARNLTALDLDLKYSENKHFLEDYKTALGGKLLKKMYAQSTMNKGMHFVFTSDVIEPNQKLASRETSPEEKHEVYIDNYKNLRTRGKALKIAQNHKSLTFLETRGEGGYIVIAPSPGYQAVYGKIGHLTAEEYEQVFTTSRSFNEYVEDHRDFKMQKYKKADVDPFEEYIKRGDVLGLLLEHGWVEVGNRRSNNVRLKRPGDPSSKDSGILDLETKVFTVFSTSTNFDVNKGYSAASTFVVLEADNDTQLAYEMLMKKGYGEKL